MLSPKRITLSCLENATPTAARIQSPILPEDLFILPVARDHLARHAQAGGDEPVLAVAVGGLVEVHEVHVDLLVGDLAVVLGGEMAVGFWRSTKPLIHILEGLKVWHQVMMPAQERADSWPRAPRRRSPSASWRSPCRPPIRGPFRRVHPRPFRQRGGRRFPALRGHRGTGCQPQTKFILLHAHGVVLPFGMRGTRPPALSDGIRRRASASSACVKRRVGLEALVVRRIGIEG